MHRVPNYNNPFLAFVRYRNFRLYWIGMCISLVGTWMQNIAQPWLALTITNNAFLVSLVSAFQFIPTLLFSLLSGVLIDKANKKQILKITQTGFLLVSVAFAVMIYSNHVRYSYILFLAFCLGLFNAVDVPCRQSFIFELIDQKEDLPNAIALNSMAFNAARILGPSVAGIVMATLGTGACFIINAISFLAILTSLFFIQTNPQPVEAKPDENMLANLQEGLHYVQDRKILSTTLIIVLIVATFIPNFNVLISAFAKYILKGDEATFGYLMSFLGIGSFLGAFYFALNSKKGPNRRVLFFMPFVTGLLMIISGIAVSFIMAGILLAVTGFTFVMITSTANSTLQLNTDNQYRGRVMSIYSLFFGGSTPFGSLYAGFFAQKLSPRWGFYSCGLAVLLFMGCTMGYHFFGQRNEPELQ